jgi:hypothetical protein
MLAVPDHDAFDQVAHVLAPIRGRLEDVEDLLPFDDRDRVGLLVEQIHDGVLVDAVRLAFELVDPRRQLQDTPLGLECLQPLCDPVGRLLDDVRQTPRAGPDLRDAVQAHDRRRRIDGIHHVVQ